MDEELVETEVPSVGERLRAAREEKGMTLEDIAAQTRIPQRHLESLETSSWDKLPAPTYTIGFARSYATVVGLDRSEISDQLRTEMGGSRPAVAAAEVFEPADPARTMPKGLVFGAIAAVVVLVLVMTWLNKRSLEEPADVNATAAEAPVPAPAAAPPPQAAAAQGPVVLTATAPAWIQIRDQGRTLFEGQLAPGQSFTVPPGVVAPLLRAGAPEALRITVGNSVAPPVGPAGQVTSNVSLLPADLMRGGQQATAPAATPAATTQAQVQRPRSTSRTRRPPPPRAPAAPAPALQAAPTNTTG
jgi:transcriptional regulator with XRE-family HTH domain